MRFVRGKHFDWIEPAAVRGLNQELPHPRRRTSPIVLIGIAATLVLMVLYLVIVWRRLREHLSPAEIAFCAIACLVVGWALYVLVYRTRILVTRKAIHRFERWPHSPPRKWELPSIERCATIRCVLPNGEYTGILLRLADGDAALVGVHPDVAVDDLAAFLADRDVAVVRRDQGAEALSAESLAEWLATEAEET